LIGKDHGSNCLEFIGAPCRASEAWQTGNWGGAGLNTLHDGKLATLDKSMIQLNFTNEEETLLNDEVKKRLVELDNEIAHTDTMDFKDMLQRRREMFRKLLGKLPDIRRNAV
jgi:hypothetical protein